MKSTVVEPQQDASSFVQKMTKCDTEIARLSAQEKQLALQIQANQAELEALQRAAIAHETAKQTAQITINQRRADLRQAEAESEISEGTLSNTKPDIKKLERLLKQAQQEQLLLLDKIAKAEQGEDRRRLALTEACEKHQRDLAQLAERKEAMEATKQRAWAEWGQAVYTARVQELENLREALNAKEQEIQALKADLDDMGQKAVESLEKWPALAEQLSTTLPYEDNATTTLEAAIALLDILLTRGHDVASFDTALLRSAGIHWGSIHNLLSWDESATADALYQARRSEPITLRDKKKSLTNLLRVYLAQKQEERVQSLHKEKRTGIR